MEPLRQQDLRRGLAVLQAVAAAGSDVAEFARAGVAALPTLAAAEITTLSICDLRSGQRQVFASPDCSIGAAERASFDRHFRVHPLVLYHGGQQGQGAHRISDSQPWQRFRHSALYSEYYRRIGIDHVVALPLYVDQRTLVSFVLNRKGRDFQDREVAALNLIRGHLGCAYLLAVALQAARATITRQSALLEQCRAGAVHESADRPGLRLEALTLTRREREVLDWLAAGKTDREIAALIDCSPRTVQKHLERVYVKLGVENRTAAVMRALGR